MPTLPKIKSQETINKFVIYHANLNYLSPVCPKPTIGYSLNSVAEEYLNHEVSPIKKLFNLLSLKNSGKKEMLVATVDTRWIQKKMLKNKRRCQNKQKWVVCVMVIQEGK